MFGEGILLFDFLLFTSHIEPLYHSVCDLKLLSYFPCVSKCPNIIYIETVIGNCRGQLFFIVPRLQSLN